MAKVIRKRAATKPAAKTAKVASKAKKSASPAKQNKRATKEVAKAVKRDPSPASDEEIVERKQVISNGVAVDHLVPSIGSYTVVSHSGTVMNNQLMFADCGNNNNKFYIIQGLKNGNAYSLWTRWGRVGVDGQSAMQPWASDYNLYGEYNKKLRQKISKGYTKIEISYDDAVKEDKKANKKTNKDKKAVKSNLPDETQSLMKFIFDVGQIEKSVVKIGFNVKKLPLGKLSKLTIKNGYETLKKIENALKVKDNKSLINDLSSEFYRYIPHDFKFANMSQFIIDTKEKLKDKLTLVETLSDIQISTEITNSADDDEKLNELDARYKQLKCDLKPLDSSSKEYKSLMQIIGFKHSSCVYPSKIEVLDIFKIDRQGESKKFKKNIGNRKLLWHGSTFSNWGGILSQGLRIAPPEAPAWGYALGKGVYFADVINKSAGYTRYSMSNNIGLLALCDVAVGKTYNTTNYDWSLNLTKIKGNNSTFWKGQYVPSKEENLNGANLQLGPLKDLSSTNWIQHSEIVIYDTDQICMKYLFKCKFS